MKFVIFSLNRVINLVVLSHADIADLRRIIIAAVSIQAIFSPYLQAMLSTSATVYNSVAEYHKVRIEATGFAILSFIIWI